MTSKTEKKPIVRIIPPEITENFSLITRIGFGYFKSSLLSATQLKLYSYISTGNLYAKFVIFLYIILYASGHIRPLAHIYSYYIYNSQKCDLLYMLRLVLGQILLEHSCERCLDIEEPYGVPAHN